MSTSPRLHALDSLRGLMMWLGIVLHVGVQHLTGPSPLPWRDPQTTPWADLLTSSIHAFRMPVFFVLAGFFMALLSERRGPDATLKHRMRRLALPFAIFWPPVFMVMGMLALAFMHRAQRGSWGIDPALMPLPPGMPQVNTVHLWFVWQLIGFALVTWAVLRAAPLLPSSLRRAFTGSFVQLGRRPWGALVLALPLVLAGASYPLGILSPSNSFLPRWEEWLQHGVFLVFGWCLYGAREVLFATLMRRWAVHAGVGLVLYLCTGFLVKKGALVLGSLLNQALAIAFVYGLCSWAWSFALIGFFLKHVPERSAALGYLAESSYWVYIVHMIGTIGIGALLVTAPWPALVKMVVNIVVTSVLGLVSYQLFVRHTWVGRLLNGAARTPAPAPASQVAA
jgi:hypothetical protein